MGFLFRNRKNFLCTLFLGAMLVIPSFILAEEPYALDDVSRIVPARGKVKCPKLELVRYEGETVRYHKPVKVHPLFQERLRRFEEVVRDAAIEVYGRPPTKIKHIGTYNCRRIRAYPDFLSEHALGNGIDVAGFDFGRLPRGETLPDDLPASLKKGFRVRVEKDWGATSRTGRIHARFLRLLSRRLIARDDIFRVLLGPGFPGHHNHFHFDCAPYAMTDGFEE